MLPMFSFQKTYLIILFHVFALPLIAAPDLKKPLTISELVAIGLENHPATRQAWWNANRAAAAVGNAKSEFYPSVDLVGVANHGRDFKFINGPNTEYTIVGADVILSMMLFDFGERSADLNAAKKTLLAARWQVDNAMQKVMVDVLENAYSTLHAWEVFNATASSLEDAEKVYMTAAELNKAGLSPITDIYTSRATLASMKMEMIKQKAQLEIQKGKLAAGLGLQADSPLILAPIEMVPPAHLCPVEELLSLAFKQRADLMAKQAEVSASIYAQAKVRASYKPKVLLTGRGGVNHALHDKGKRRPISDRIKRCYSSLQWI